MVVLTDVGQVEAHFGQFRNSINLSARWEHDLHRMYHGNGNPFGHTQWYSKVTCVMWKLISVYLEIALILRQDRCTVCIECATGIEIFLGTPDCTSR
jgi:hypothetical protein